MTVSTTTEALIVGGAGGQTAVVYRERAGDRRRRPSALYRSHGLTGRPDPRAFGRAPTGDPLAVAMLGTRIGFG